MDKELTKKQNEYFDLIFELDKFNPKAAVKMRNQPNDKIKKVLEFFTRLKNKEDRKKYIANYKTNKAIIGKSMLERKAI